MTDYGTGATITVVGTTEAVATITTDGWLEIVAIKFNGIYVMTEAGATTGETHESGIVTVSGNVLIKL
jgi:hypothetical protein